jgi:hypothetical protein
MVFISLQRGVSSIVFFINEFLSKFFSNPADVRRRLCDRSSLSNARPGATNMLATS